MNGFEKLKAIFNDEHVGLQWIAIKFSPPVQSEEVDSVTGDAVGSAEYNVMFDRPGRPRLVVISSHGHNVAEYELSLNKINL